MTSSPNVPLRYINAAEVSDLNLLCHGNSVALLSEQSRLARHGCNQNRYKDSNSFHNTNYSSAQI